MTRFSRLLRVCSWCARLQEPPVSEPTEPGVTGTTHGMCQGCAEQFTWEVNYG